MEIEIKPGQRFLIDDADDFPREEVPDPDEVTVLELSPSGMYVKVKGPTYSWYGVGDFKARIVEVLTAESSENALSTLMKELAPILAPYLLDYLKGQKSEATKV